MAKKSHENGGIFSKDEKGAKRRKKSRRDEV